MWEVCRRNKTSVPLNLAYNEKLYAIILILDIISQHSQYGNMGAAF